MRINPKACSDTRDYKLTAYKCQAGSHGCDGTSSPGCAVNIPQQMIERLSGGNELNLLMQLLYIDGLHPQVIKVTFQLWNPPPYSSPHCGSLLSGWHFIQFLQTNDQNHLLPCGTLNRACQNTEFWPFIQKGAGGNCTKHYLDLQNLHPDVLGLGRAGRTLGLEWTQPTL